MTRSRAGFTIVELLIVSVLGSLVVAAALQVLIVNQRTYTAQTEAISGQQTTRMSLDVLFNELREVSSSGGDIRAMASDSLRVRLMRKFGFVCQTNFTGTPVLLVIPWGIGVNAFEDQDSVFVYADNDPDISTDDAWFSGKVTALAAGACPQDGTVAQLLSFNGQSSAFAADSVGIGAPVRAFEEYTFGTVTVGGDTYFGRRTGNGDMVPVAGPIRAPRGLQFTYRDANGTVTSTATDVRQIEVVVRTGGDVLNAMGGMVSDSISTWIFARN